MKLILTYRFSIVLLLVSFCIFSCKKEVDVFEKDSNLPKVIDLDPGRMLAHHNKSDGGSIIVHNPMNGSQRDVYISVLDESGKLIRTNVFGGSRNEYINHTIMDAEGNLYIVGGTSSPELRMDANKDITDATDNYLAKVDKHGNLMWQVGYCNVNSLLKGVQEDELISIAIVHGKLFCMGYSGNEEPLTPVGVSDYKTNLIIFDLNGNVLKDMILPSLVKGSSVLNFGGWSWMDAIKLEDNNLIIRYSYFDYLSEGRNMDTTTLVFKYNTITESVMWSQYFLRTSPQHDLANMGQLGNGNLVFFDSYYNSISILDQHTGNPISHRVFAYNSSNISSTIYATKYYCNNFKMGDDYYVVGWMNIGGGNTDLKPWMIKLDKDGNIIYNKIFPIQSSRFWYIRETANKNLQLTGSIAVFGTFLEKIFTINITPNGEIIKSN